QIFGSTLSSMTGLDPNVVAAWEIAEEPKSASQAPNGANNWLNIGAFDSGNWAFGSDPKWATPQSGGQATAEFLEGKWGGASQGERNILNSVNGSPQSQIQALQNSGWAGN